jgi:glucokinase
MRMDSTDSKLPLVIGIEIGGTKLQLVAGNRARGIIARQDFLVEAARGGEGIREQIAASLPKLLQQHDAAAIGVGFGGPLDRQKGRIACSHQLPGWDDFPLRDWLEKISGLPVVVENDANAAAWGEANLGAGAGFDPVLYITLGSGVGGGLVAGHKIYHGDSPGELEIGHLRMDPRGATLEDCCSGWAIDRVIREARAAHPESALYSSGATGPEAARLGGALAVNDPLALKILHDLAANLALGLSHATHLLHPQVIVIGGGLSQIGEPLRALVAEKLPPLLMKSFRPGPCLALAACGRDAVPLGALLLAAEAPA